jgi:y4mF family transcriptional regulator
MDFRSANQQNNPVRENKRPDQMTNRSEEISLHNTDELGAAIRKARKAQGLTQQEFADVTGVGVRFLSELERGKETAEVGLVLRVLLDAGFDVILRPRRFGS